MHTRTPQIDASSENPIEPTRRTLRLTQLVARHVDCGQLTRSVGVLAPLSNPECLSHPKRFLEGNSTEPQFHPSVSADIPAIRKTASGYLVIGSQQQNTYTLGNDIALVLDLGGGNTNTGTIMATSDIKQGIRAVIALSGNDHYQSANFDNGLDAFSVLERNVILRAMTRTTRHDMDMVPRHTTASGYASIQMTTITMVPQGPITTEQQRGIEALRFRST